MSLTKEMLCLAGTEKVSTSAILHCEKGSDDFVYSQSYGYYGMGSFGSVQVLDFKLPNIYGEIYDCSIYAIYDDHENNMVNFGFSLSLDADDRRTNISQIYIVRLDTFIGLAVNKPSSGLIYKSSYKVNTPLFSDTDINRDIPLYLSNKAPSFSYTDISA